MNLIPKICELLGVEIGEEFKIAKSKDDMFFGRYKFEEDGLKTLCYTAWVNAESACYKVLNGELNVIKLPFEPKEGEMYYFVFWNDTNGLDVGFGRWHNMYHNYTDKYLGNCFRTAEEAEAHMFEIYEKLTGKEWGK